MTSKRNFAVALLSCLCFALTMPVQAADQGAGAAIYNILSTRNYLDAYLLPMIDEITADVVKAAGRWRGYQINRPYREGFVNVYLVDSARLPEVNALAPYDIPLARSDLYDAFAITDEISATIFIDTRSLREFVASSNLKPEFGDLMPAIASVRLYGLEKVRSSWDQTLNPELRSSNQLSRMQQLTRGAMAFVIAHEMGHIVVGKREPPDVRRTHKPYTGKDRDTYHACPELIDPERRAKQAVEKAADDFAAQTLANVCVEKPRHLRYELGAEWYFLYLMNKKLLYSVKTTQSRFIHTTVRNKVGEKLYAALVAQPEDLGRGSVHLTFPPSHPPDYRRVAESLGKLHASPCSLNYGEPAASPQMQLLDMFTVRACQDLASRYGAQ